MAADWRLTRRAWLTLTVWAAGSLPLSAQVGLGGQARLIRESSVLSSDLRRIDLNLALSQPVPYRLRLLSAPPRLVLDLNTLDWDNPTQVFGDGGAGLREWRVARLPDGWARLVLDMAGPYLPELTEQSVDTVTGQAQIRLRLARVSLTDFEAHALTEADFLRRNSDVALHPRSASPAQRVEARKPVILLDPGHGGIDPGAERDGVRESDLVLSFSRLLREELLRRGRVDVAMSRDADVFVPLDDRLRAARAAGADVLISIHADAVPEGLATGSVIYLLAEDATDEAAAYLAERHGRADLLAGVDLAHNTDEIARVLMSLAWQDNGPRARALAEALVDGIRADGLRLHRRPIQGAAFNVLRAPDIPSVLVELGFMSSPRDLANLRDPDWNARMAKAMADGLEAWLVQDQARAALQRN